MLFVLTFAVVSDRVLTRRLTGSWENKTEHFASCYGWKFLELRLKSTSSTLCRGILMDSDLL